MLNDPEKRFWDRKLKKKYDVLEMLPWGELSVKHLTTISLKEKNKRKMFFNGACITVAKTTLVSCGMTGENKRDWRRLGSTSDKSQIAETKSHSMKPSYKWTIVYFF